MPQFWKVRNIPFWTGRTSELRSTGPKLVPLMATGCPYHGRYVWAQVNWTQVSSTLGHEMPLLGGTSQLKSTGHNLVPHFTTRCLYLGVHLHSGQLDTTLYQSWPPDASTGGTSDQRSIWPKGWQNVKLTWHSTALAHQMPLLGGMSELRSTRLT